MTGANRELVDLTRDDLVVLEDGVAQKVDTFQEAVAPVSVVLALDASGSMIRAADGVRTAALSFVEALRPEDALSVLLFSDTSAFAHDLTTDRQQSIAAVNAYVARGGTALYDGLTDALMRLKQTEGRKVVVLLSDGRDEDNAGTGPGSARTQNDVFARTQGDRRDDLPHRPRTSRRSRIARAAGGRVRRRRLLSGGRLEPARRLRAHRRGAAPPLRRQLHVHECRARRRAGVPFEIKTRQPELTVRSRGGYSAPER